MLLMLQASPLGASKLDGTPCDGTPFDCSSYGAMPSPSDNKTPASSSSSFVAFLSDVFPHLTKPTPSAKEMLANPTPLSAYTNLEAATGVVSLQLCCVQGLFACMHCVYRLSCRLLRKSHHHCWACMIRIERLQLFCWLDFFMFSCPESEQQTVSGV